MQSEQAESAAKAESVERGVDEVKKIIDGLIDDLTKRAGDDLKANAIFERVRERVIQREPKGAEAPK